MQATGLGYPITSSPNTSSSLPAEAKINGDGFWPDVDPAHFRATMRIDGTATTQRVEAELINAITTTNNLLRVWRTVREASLPLPFDATVPGVSLLNQQTIAWHLYQRAVYCFAAANLQERYQTFDNTAEGRRRAEYEAYLIDQLRRDAHWAIADLEGRTRCTVELV